MSINIFTRISTKILFSVFAFVLMTTSWYAEYMPTPADDQLIEKVGTALTNMAMAKWDLAWSRFINQMLGALDRIEQKSTSSEKLMYIISELKITLSSLYGDDSDVSEETNNLITKVFQSQWIPFTFEYDSSFWDPQVEMIITNKWWFLKQKNGVFNGSLPEQWIDFDLTSWFQYDIITNRWLLQYVSKDFNSDAFWWRMWGWWIHNNASSQKEWNIRVWWFPPVLWWEDAIPIISFVRYFEDWKTLLRFNLELRSFYKDVQWLDSECYTMWYDFEWKCAETIKKTNEYLTKSIEKHKTDKSILDLLNSAKEIK